MKSIIIFGTGAVAAEIESYVKSNVWISEDLKVKGFIASDENGIVQWRKYNLQSPYLGHIMDYNIDDDDYFILALGSYSVKREISDILKQKGGKFFTFIHPSSIVAPSAEIGEGCILYPQTIVGPNVKLGRFNLLTSQSIVSHDCNVGDFNFFATALLCGYNNIGDDNYFGIRGTTLPNVNIGNRNKIQAGMIVDKNIGDDSTCFYRYKEKIVAISIPE